MIIFSPRCLLPGKMMAWILVSRLTSFWLSAKCFRLFGESLFFPRTSFREGLTRRNSLMKFFKRNSMLSKSPPEKFHTKKTSRETPLSLAPPRRRGYRGWGDKFRGHILLLNNEHPAQEDNSFETRITKHISNLKTIILVQEEA